MPPTPKTTTYLTLLAQVRRTLLEGQARIEAERVKTYWQTGQIIYKDILENKGRGKYGVEITKRLAEDLKINLSTLRRCVQFAKTYPELPKVDTGRLFSWSHYRKLIPVSDDKKRQRLEREAVRNNWSVQELSARIQEEKPAHISSDSPRIAEDKGGLKPVEKFLTPLRGKLFHCQIVKRPTLGGEGEAELYLDLGFGNFIDLTEEEAAQYAAGDMVELDPRKKEFVFAKVKAAPKDLYTYKAVVEKVIDGDTLKVRFYLGGRVRRRETLRLRGLDCPEIDTKEGQAAKTFVQSYIKEAQTIVVRSSRSDKWDRYLADVFVMPSTDSEKELVIKTANVSRAKRDGIAAVSNDAEIYINNLLLEKGFARRMD